MKNLSHLWSHYLYNFGHFYAFRLNYLSTIHPALESLLEKYLKRKRFVGRVIPDVNLNWNPFHFSRQLILIFEARYQLVILKCT